MCASRHSIAVTLPKTGCSLYLPGNCGYMKPFLKLGHVITGKSHKNILCKGHKNREPQSINLKYNFKLLMNCVDEYARKCTKRVKEDVDTILELVKALRSLI